jgi:hypothetical protein
MALAGFGAAHAATIYKWTDERGGVHYSNERPPAHVKATVIDTSEPVRSDAAPERRNVAPPVEVDTPGDPALPSAPEPQTKRPSLQEREAAFQKRRTERLAAQASEEEAAASEARSMKRACDRARMSLAQAVAAPPRLAQKARANTQTDVWVYYPDDYEAPASINNAARSEKIEMLESYIAKHCGK